MHKIWHICQINHAECDDVIFIIIDTCHFGPIWSKNKKYLDLKHTECDDVIIIFLKSLTPVIFGLFILNSNQTSAIYETNNGISR